MVIESLKAAQTALKEAMKDKGMSATSKKQLEESDSRLQKLIEEARAAAKEAEAYQGEEEEEESEGMAGEKKEEEEAGKDGEHDGDEPHGDMPKSGHTVTITHKVKHDGPTEDDADADGDDGDDDKKDAEESKRVHIQVLLKEAGIPKGAINVNKLMRMPLAEAKAEIAEKKALVELISKEVAKESGTINLSMGEPVRESSGGENLNGLFSGCAR